MPSSDSEVRPLLRRLTGKEHTVLLGRAVTGMWATLRALGYAKRRILLPANTCYIVLWAVLHSGNLPLLVDVDPNTANLNLDTLERAAIENAAAIIPCHMYGLSAPMDAICAWAHAHGIFVIEDATLALGGQADGQPAGYWGDVSVFSFGLGKIVDNQVGGALVTDDEKLAVEIARILADLPVWDNTLIDLTNQWNNFYWALHQYEVQNPRLLTLYPSLFDIYRPLVAYQLMPLDWENLPDALRGLDDNLAHRAALAASYDARLRGLPIQRLERPAGSILWRYPLLAAPEQRDDLLAHLWENGVHDATRWYPSLRYMASALAPDMAQPPTPNADWLGASILNLRLDPGVDMGYVERTAELIAGHFEE